MAVLAAFVPASLLAEAGAAAARDGITVSMWARRLIERELRDPRAPMPPIEFLDLELIDGRAVATEIRE